MITDPNLIVYPQSYVRSFSLFIFCLTYDIQERQNDPPTAFAVTKKNVSTTFLHDKLIHALFVLPYVFLPHRLFRRANGLNSNFAFCQCDAICWLDEIPLLTTQQSIQLCLSFIAHFCTHKLKKLLRRAYLLLEGFSKQFNEFFSPDHLLKLVKHQTTLII